MITIDGIEWEIPCQITRACEISSSEISGMLLNGNYFNDVIGSYMRYDISLAVPVGMEDDYSTLYETLTDPSSYHFFVLPYNQTQIQIYARIETVSDKYYKQERGKAIWRGSKFTIIANHPSKVKTLDDVISVGISPTPDVSEPEIGEVYEYTADGWVIYESEYEDADDNEY